jgi:N-acetylneuraminic acid mutarotase
MPTARTALRTAEVNGILYAVGGTDANNPAGLATVEAYDPSKNTWTTKASMPGTRGSMALAVANGSLYVIGGGCASGICDTVVAYDPSSDSWSTKSPMPTRRYELVAGVAKGEIYAIGGYNDISAGGYLSAVESYDPFTNAWTASNLHTGMPTARYALGMGAIGGLLYAVGGSNNSGLIGALEAYDATTDSWTIKASMPTPRLSLGVGVSGGLLFAVGGADVCGQACAATGTLEVYNAAANSWSTRTSMPTARWSMGVTMINGILYAAGGNSNGVIVGTLEAYTP